MTYTALQPRGDVPLPPDMPPVPKGKITLLGGTLRNVDPVRDRLLLHAFGGGTTTVLFDQRTHVFRDGQSASLDDLKDGENASLDTVLDGTSIFAKNIRLRASGPAGHMNGQSRSNGQSNGQIVDFHPSTGELLVRDVLSSTPVTMQIVPDTVIRHQQQIAQATDLRPGSLVALEFSATGGSEPVVRQVSILASPGGQFTFAGRVEELDMLHGLLVLTDPRDDKAYEISLNLADRGVLSHLQLGANVTVQATFDGTVYAARDIQLTAVPAQP